MLETASCFAPEEERDEVAEMRRLEEERAERARQEDPVRMAISRANLTCETAVIDEVDSYKFGKDALERHRHFVNTRVKMSEKDKRAQKLAGGGIKEIVPYPCIVTETEQEYYWSFDEMPFAYGMIAKRQDTQAPEEEKKENFLMMTLAEMSAELEKQKAAEAAAAELKASKRQPVVGAYGEAGKGRDARNSISTGLRKNPLLRVSDSQHQHPKR
jgi:hypothetical protein